MAGELPKILYAHLTQASCEFIGFGLLSEQEIMLVVNKVFARVERYVKALSTVVRNNLPSAISFLFKSVIVVGLVSFFANVYSDRHARAVVKQEVQYIQNLREQYQGLWLIRIRIDESEYRPYSGLASYYQGVLSIDNSLSILGDMYMLKDVIDAKEHYYEREFRRHSEVRGSIIENRVQLTLHSDYEAKKSLEFLDGVLTKDGIQGNFVSEVAGSKGRFCMIRMSASNLSNDLDCQLPD